MPEKIGCFSVLGNSILGEIPGKPDRLDKATRMAMDADFSDRRESMQGVYPSGNVAFGR
jgi:hypothetical protein